MDLTLYIPGLFGPEARFSRDYVPPAPALELLLSRATRIAPPPGAPHEILSALLGVSIPPGADAPVAAVTRIVDAGNADGNCWLRADPVHLRADRAGLALIDATGFRLSNHDALALAADIRQVLAGVGELEVPRPQRWYLKLRSIPRLRTRELDEVAGHDVRRSLPMGEDAPLWHRLLNEIQMVMHAHAVNRLRESRGEPAVNSLWFWGCGVLPAETPQRWARVFGGGPYVEGLARLAATPFAPGIERVADALAGAGNSTRTLVILDTCVGALRAQDLRAWTDGIAALEAAWFAPCLRLLQSRALGRLEILTDRFRFRLAPLSLLKFWRKETLVKFIAGAIAPAGDVKHVDGRW